MQHKVEFLYKKIVDYFDILEAASSKVLLSEQFVKEIETVIANGSKQQKHMVIKFFVCSILDGRVKGYSYKQGMNLVADSLKENNKKLPDYIYNRILSLVNKLKQDEAISFLLLSFNLKKYDAIADLGYMLLSGQFFGTNSESYLSLIYSLLLESLRTSEKKFIAVIFHLLRHIVKYEEIIKEEALQLLENTMLSEYWTPKHTGMVEHIMISHACLHTETTIIEINNRLKIVDPAVLNENLSSSLSFSRI